jgi:hypothetical protein
MSTRTRLLTAALATVALSGCFYEPCDDYVDYLCTCHADDPQYDCDVLEASYLDAEPEIQDQCAIDLADVQEQDEDEGLECEY